MVCLQCHFCLVGYIVVRTQSLRSRSLISDRNNTTKTRPFVTALPPSIRATFEDAPLRENCRVPKLQCPTSRKGEALQVAQGRGWPSKVHSWQLLDVEGLFRVVRHQDAKRETNAR